MTRKGWEIAAPAAGLAAVLATSTVAAADTPPPSVAQIKACVQQMDPMGKHRFVWKSVTLGPARPPRDNYEAMDLWGWQTPRKGPGYPIHVVYSFDGAVDIDSTYWITLNAQGKWQIPLICTIP